MCIYFVYGKYAVHCARGVSFIVWQNVDGLNNPHRVVFYSLCACVLHWQWWCVVVMFPVFCYDSSSCVTRRVRRTSREIAASFWESLRPEKVESLLYVVVDFFSSFIFCFNSIDIRTYVHVYICSLYSSPIVLYTIRVYIHKQMIVYDAMCIRFFRWILCSFMPLPFQQFAVQFHLSRWLDTI